MAEVRRGGEYFLTSKLCETACRMAEGKGEGLIRASKVVPLSCGRGGRGEGSIEF